MRLWTAEIERKVRIIEHEADGQTTETINIVFGAQGQILSHSGGTCDQCGEGIQPNELVRLMTGADVERVSVSGWLGLRPGEYAVVSPRPPVFTHDDCALAGTRFLPQPPHK